MRRDLEPLPPEEQMVRDWAAVGLRRLEAHLALHAAFEEYLGGGGEPPTDEEDQWPEATAR